MALITEKRCTAEEYFELEKQSEVRHEFVYGYLIEMAGESKRANEIAQNFIFSVRRELRQKGYATYEHDVRLMVRKGQIYRYPNAVIAPILDDEDAYHVTQPVLIVEVLSNSTKETDRIDKLIEYRELPTLQYYFLIAQDAISVELYRRNEKGIWEYVYFTDLYDTIELSYFGTQITLEAIYEGIVFSI